MKRAVFVSDLHLGVGADHNVEDFHSDAEFSELVDCPELTPSNGSEVDLVILGDGFDFWQVAEANEYHASRASDVRLDYDSALEQDRLGRIAEAHPDFFKALRRFSSRQGCRLYFVVGNHDHSLVDDGVKARLRQLVGRDVVVAANYDQPDLGVFAEHGNQWDDNNQYSDLGIFDWQKDCPGYYFVRLFWNRMEALDPELDDSPEGWRAVWHYLLKAARKPELLGRAVRYWIQYKRDQRIPEGLTVSLAGADVAVDGPELLMAPGNAENVFSNDPIVEHAFREAYHLYPEVRQEVDALRGAELTGVAPVPFPNANLGLSELREETGLGGQDDVRDAYDLFRRPPTGCTERLTSDTYRYVLFGHTHRRRESELQNGAWYFNTGTWAGKTRKDLTVVTVESDGATTQARFGRFLGGGLRLGPPR